MIGRRVLNAIRELKNTDGSSLPEIKKYLASRYSQVEVPAADDIKTYFKAAVEHGTLDKTGRKYKIIEKGGRKTVAKEGLKQQRNIKDDSKKETAIKNQKSDTTDATSETEILPVPVNISSRTREGFKRQLDRKADSKKTTESKKQKFDAMVEAASEEEIFQEPENVNLPNKDGEVLNDSFDNAEDEFRE